MIGCTTAKPQPLNSLRLAVQAPGVKQVRDSLFLDETEVANIHWLEYLHFIRRDSSAAFYRSQLPDSLAVPQLRKPGAPAADTVTAGYLRHPAYRYYPVVGITQAQASNYCRWRSATVQQRLQVPAGQPDQGRYAGPNRKRLSAYRVRVAYRLPTPAEWELAASASAPAPATPEPTALADINSHAPNQLGIRNLNGNVAELTALPSVIKGGSWKQPGVPFRADLPNPGPRPWLGFRCACEVLVTPRAK